jgi:hypothetical protein
VDRPLHRKPKSLQRSLQTEKELRESERERETKAQYGLGFRVLATTQFYRKRKQAVSIAVVFLLPDCLLGFSSFSGSLCVRERETEHEMGLGFSV